MILLIGTTTTVFPITQGPPSTGTKPENQYILIGGQNGTWFQVGQAPRLYRIMLSNYSVTKLTPVSSQGTVWGGSWNGSQWLISGWGTDPGPNGSNPYIYLDNGLDQVVAGTLKLYDSESSWHGGDIFCSSYNGKLWLLSGLGSDALPPASGQAANHMSLATFDGYNFTDLSSMVPRQDDAILYANAWNGNYWLVGGGYGRPYYSIPRKVLFAFDGITVTDLTSQADESLPTFGPVQAIGWNGRYWLIGGIGFLASFDGHRFVDLTSGLSALLGEGFTVNAMAWDGHEWMLAGGAPVAEPLPSKAWVVSYSSFGFVDLSQSLPQYITRTTQSSSILTIAYAYPYWIFGGYSWLDGGMLLSYQNGSFKDLSYLAKDMSYVIWIGAGMLKGSQQESPSLSFAPLAIMVLCSVSSCVSKNPRRR